MEKKYLRRRIFSGIIDYSVISIYIALQFYFYGVPDGNGGYELKGFSAVSVFIFWFVFIIASEQFFGATIGNILNKIKPSSLEDDGSKKISFIQSCKRHLLDPVDMSFFGLVGILLIKNTEKGQRLGDLWAKTKIVKI